METLKLSLVERQILYNQFLILEEILDDPDYGVNAKILEQGFTRDYRGLMNVTENEIDVETCRETVQIFEMYRNIDNAIARLEDEEKESLDLDQLKFQGFDANNDDHYRYAEFMINDLGKWDEYESFALDSHGASSLHKYRTMLEKQAEIKESRDYSSVAFDLSINDLRNMINAI